MSDVKSEIPTVSHSALPTGGSEGRGEEVRQGEGGRKKLAGRCRREER